MIAHEVFHCFMHSLVHGDGNAASLGPMWMKEGSAAWAGETLVEGSAQSSTWWLNWLVFSDRPLLWRTYDALGFWSLLDATGVDTWRQLDAVMRDIPRAYERSEEHTSELQSLMRMSYAVICLKKK